LSLSDEEVKSQSTNLSKADPPKQSFQAPPIASSQEIFTLDLVRRGLAMLSAEQRKALKGADERRLKDSFKGLAVSGHIAEVRYPDGSIYLGQVKPATQIRHGTGVLIIVKQLIVDGITWPPIICEAEFEEDKPNG